ncbi:MAG: hypothetical protein U0527_14960 [Candidatus Eisenbacteria bacterium]
MPEPPRLLRPRAALLAAALLLAWSTPGFAQLIRLAAGGGIGVPYSGTQRSVYATESHLTLGIAAPLSANDVWVYLEATRAATSGQPYSDPTFVPERTKLRWYPCALGFRANSVPRVHRRQVALYLGAAAILAPMVIDPPFAPSKHSAVSGLAFEFRPEVALPSGWRLWARDRVLLLATNEFGRFDLPEVSPSGSAFELGLSRDFGRREVAR